MAEDPPEPSFKPDMEGIEDRARLFRLVDQLPKDQRRVIFERFVEQRSIREIAAELGRSEGAVKQLQFRALQNLRGADGGRTCLNHPDSINSTAAIDAMLARPGSEQAHLDKNSAATLAPLIDIARELRDLPRENFKARLKSRAGKERIHVSEAVASSTPAGDRCRKPHAARLRVK